MKGSGEEDHGLPHPGQAAVPDLESPTGEDSDSNPDFAEPHPRSVKLGQSLFALVWRPSGEGPANSAREGKCEGVGEKRGRGC